MAFIPPAWLERTPGAPLPTADDLRAWQGFGVAQTGQLTKANDKFDAAVHIFAECERRNTAARPRRKILGIF
jgi:hypothetical protein